MCSNFVPTRLRAKRVENSIAITWSCITRYQGVRNSITVQNDGMSHIFNLPPNFVTPNWPGGKISYNYCRDYHWSSFKRNRKKLNLTILRKTILNFGPFTVMQKVDFQKSFSLEIFFRFFSIFFSSWLLTVVMRCCVCDPQGPPGDLKIRAKQKCSTYGHFVPMVNFGPLFDFFDRGSGGL